VELCWLQGLCWEPTLASAREVGNNRRYEGMKNLVNENHNNDSVNSYEMKTLENIGRTKKYDIVQ